MWVCIVSGFETQRSGISVHFLDEVLDRLIWCHSSLVVLVCCLVILNISWQRVRVLTSLLSLLTILLLLLFIIFVSSGHLKQILAEMLS
jgi:vacuolar-type H+-ATPase subunit I/STV1